jgi:hypothetical protein
MDEEDTGTVNWNSQLETILSQEGERALCFAWLHVNSQKKYDRLNTYITLPTITMSTLAGSAAIGSSSIFSQIPDAANYIIGGISLSVALLNTVSSFFGWAKRSEAHRLSATSYTKIHRFMMIELALPWYRAHDRSRYAENSHATNWIGYKRHLLKFQMISFTSLRNGSAIQLRK